MITLWPSNSLSLSASRRPTKSVGPPAGKAMTTLIGRDGNSCGHAAPMLSAAATIANTSDDANLKIALPPGVSKHSPESGCTLNAMYVRLFGAERPLDDDF